MMPGAYAYTPAIWLPLTGAALEAVLGLYCWQRRDTPAVRPLLYAILFTFCSALATAFAAAALDPVAKVGWYKFRAACILPAVAAELCFVLEYTYPGRWLTRRNLALLALPPLLAMLLLFTGRSQDIWRSVAPPPDGWGVQDASAVGLAFLSYITIAGLAGAVALLWLFILSPQHRWSAGLMLASQVVSSILFLVNFVSQLSARAFDVGMVVILMVSTVYVVAVFGFRIFDPLPAARQAVLEQMHPGVVVFDPGWRILSLNPAAEAILGTAADAARGKSWPDVLPVASPLPQLPPERAALGGKAIDLPEVTVGSGANARSYAPALSDLRDFRGLLLGYLLMLRDVTEQRRAHAQALEQQRVLAALNERERMARELHDSLGQVLSYTSMQVETAAQLALSGRGEAAAAQLARLGQAVREGHADLREYILNLASTARPDRSLHSALHQYLAGATLNYNVRTQLNMDPNLDERILRPEVKLHLLRIVQEALSNARRHGGAHRVEVTLARANGCLRLTVEDDGCGFDAQLAERIAGSQHGLGFMRARAEELGGSVAVTSSPGCGARVTLEMPVGEAGPAENRRS